MSQISRPVAAAVPSPPSACDAVLGSIFGRHIFDAAGSSLQLQLGVAAGTQPFTTFPSTIEVPMYHHRLQLATPRAPHSLIQHTNRVRLDFLPRMPAPLRCPLLPLLNTAATHEQNPRRATTQRPIGFTFMNSPCACMVVLAFSLLSRRNETNGALFDFRRFHHSPLQGHSL